MITLDIKKWRRSSGMKQETLARLLGVSQTAVSRWELGLDNPSPANLSRLRDIITQDTSSTIRIERRKLELQAGLQVMLDLDGMKQLASSRLCQQLFPRLQEFQDQYTADYLIGKTAEIYSNVALIKSIRKNEVAMITGTTSDGHLKDMDELAFKHRWSVTFQKLFTTHYIYLSLEACEPTDEADNYTIHYLDDLR